MLHSQGCKRVTSRNAAALLLSTSWHVDTRVLSGMGAAAGRGLVTPLASICACRDAYQQRLQWENFRWLHLLG